LSRYRTSLSFYNVGVDQSRKAVDAEGLIEEELEGDDEAGIQKPIL
jgi:hypothetical protein